MKIAIQFDKDKQHDIGFAGESFEEANRILNLFKPEGQIEVVSYINSVEDCDKTIELIEKIKTLKMSKPLKDDLRISRSIISTLIDKAWEIGGYAVGETEFEGYWWIKDAREHLEQIDKQLKE